MRKRMGVSVEPSEAMKRGAAIHTIFHETSRLVAKSVLSGYDPWDAYDYACRLCIKRFGRDPLYAKLCRAFAFAWSSIAAELGGPLAVTEMVVDGSALGLSRYLRIDALMEGGIVVELKYGSFRRDYALAVAGYALALESYLEVPIDFGLVIAVNGDGTKLRMYPIYVDNALRQEFIELRDEAIDILLSDVEPPTPSSCPSTCPYRPYCRGG